MLNDLILRTNVRLLTEVIINVFYEDWMQYCDNGSIQRKSTENSFLLARFYWLHGR
jgi:hypothetical protein